MSYSFLPLLFFSAPVDICVFVCVCRPPPPSVHPVFIKDPKSISLSETLQRRRRILICDMCEGDVIIHPTPLILFFPYQVIYCRYSLYLYREVIIKTNRWYRVHKNHVAWRVCFKIILILLEVIKLELET